MSDTTQFEIARESRSNPAGSVPGVVLIGLGLMNAVLACALCWLQPQHTPAWALAGLVLPIALLVVRLLPSSGNAARRSCCGCSNQKGCSSTSPCAGFWVPHWVGRLWLWAACSRNALRPWPGRALGRYWPLSLRACWVLPWLQQALLTR